MITALKIVEYMDTLKNQACQKIFENPDDAAKIKKEYIERIKSYKRGIDCHYGETEFAKTWNKFINKSMDNCITVIEEF